MTLARTQNQQQESSLLLDVQDLSMRFGGVVAIDRLSFQAARNEITGVIGPNGAGKTTVFNCLTGFYRPSGGQLRLHTDDRQYHLERMRGFRIARDARIVRTFQNIRLFAGMSVLENLMIAQHVTLMRASGYSLAGLFNLAPYQRAQREALERAKFWLDKVNLTSKADQLASSLSYGEQRRLEIIRALCFEPMLLCLDEPAAGLNARESDELARFLLDIRDGQGISVLLIEHDMSVVMRICDKIVVLDHGACIAQGAPAAIRVNPAVIQAYLGVDDDAPDDGVVPC